MARNRDIPGNAVASAQAYQRSMVGLAETLVRFERLADRLWEEGTYLTNISIRLPDDDHADYLMVVRGRNGDGQVVGFTSSDTLRDTVRRGIASLENGTLKWQEDKYAK